MITLKQFIENENLMEFAERYNELKKIWNRIKISDIKLLEHGYEFINGKNKYRVLLKSYDDGSFSYYGEVLNYFFDKIPCSTRNDEAKYPKSVAWIGTLLIERMNNK